MWIVSGLPVNKGELTTISFIQGVLEDVDQSSIVGHGVQLVFQHLSVTFLFPVVILPVLRYTANIYQRNGLKLEKYFRNFLE